MAGPGPSVAAIVIPYEPTVSDHVDQLLNRLQAQGCCTGWVLARDLMRIHEEMVRELGWAPKPWAPAVARALALRLQQGRKTYLDVVEVDGRRTRLRAYPMPSAAANPGSTIRDTG